MKRRAILLMTAMTLAIVLGSGVALATIAKDSTHSTGIEVDARVTPTSHDTGAPQLTSSEPSPGETMARSASITVEFSEPLDPATLRVDTVYGTADNVELYKYNKKTKKFQFFSKTSVSMDAAGDTVTLDPYPNDASRPLAAGKYKVRVWRDAFGLKDLDGNRLSTHVPVGYVLRDLKFFGPDAVIEWTIRAA